MLAPKPRMTADEFLAWAMTQPGRYELEGGVVVGMAPEKTGHVRVKAAVFMALRAAIARAGLACEAWTDGLSLRIDAETVHEPDASVTCGERAGDDVVALDDALIVVEVVSRSSSALDSGAKLEDYFRLPSLAHYLIVKPAARAVIHHRRAPGGAIATAILREGELALDPPGLTIPLAAFFA